jgi:hypothetical protein
MHQFVFGIFDDGESSIPPSAIWPPEEALTPPPEALWDRKKIGLIYSAYERARKGLSPTDDDVWIVKWAIETLGLHHPKTGECAVAENVVNSTRRCSEFVYCKFGKFFRGTLPDESDGVHFIPRDLWEAYCENPRITAQLDHKTSKKGPF